MKDIVDSLEIGFDEEVMKGIDVTLCSFQVIILLRSR